MKQSVNIDKGSEKKSSKKLTFEPTIFRDWSIAYCELASLSATEEFKKQLGWGYSDFIFLWDGKKETIYRAKEEHIDGMFNFIKEQIKNDKEFITNISEELLIAMKDYEELLNKILREDLERKSDEELLALLEEISKEYLPILPGFLIIMYFPQQLDDYYPEQKKDYERDYNICLKTRSQVDKILAPKTEEALRKISAQILRRTTIKKPEEYSRFLTINEMRNIIKNKYSEEEIRLLSNELIKRSDYFLIAGNKVRYDDLKDYLASKGWRLQESLLESPMKREGDELVVKGRPTYVSKTIKGVAKIVQNIREADKVNKGDIIIAPMTTPEYASVLKKVSAIVTDEGGITCHAAIVSRELQIPCIVGTKIATRLFNDGDLVEVNTKEGIIKRLS